MPKKITANPFEKKPEDEPETKPKPAVVPKKMVNPFEQAMKEKAEQEQADKEAALKLKM